MPYHKQFPGHNSTLFMFLASMWLTHPRTGGRERSLSSFSLPVFTRRASFEELQCTCREALFLNCLILHRCATGRFSYVQGIQYSPSSRPPLLPSTAPTAYRVCEPPVINPSTLSSKNPPSIIDLAQRYHPFESTAALRNP